MNIVRTTSLLLIGMIILALAYHLAIALRRRGDRLHASISLVCLSALLYLPFTLAIYSSGTVEEYFQNTLPQMYATALFLIGITWFTREYTGAPLGKFIAVYGPLIVFVEIVRTFSPDTLIFTAVRGLKTFMLPWGETISILDASSTAWQYIYYVLIFIPYPVILRAIWKYQRKVRKNRALVLMSGIIIFLLANFNDMAVVSLKLPWVFLTEIAFAGLIAAISLRLVDEVIKADKTRSTLDDTEIRFRSVFNVANQFIALLEPDGRIIDMNLSAIKASGMEPGSLTGRYFWDAPWWADLPDEREKLRDAVTRARAGETVHIEINARGKKGDLRVMDCSMVPVTADDGRIVYIVPEGRDITELRRANDKISRQVQELQAAMEELEATNEEFETQNAELIRSENQLRDSEEKYRGLVENISETVFSVDAGGTITYISPGIERIGKFSSRELIGKSFQDFIHPEDREKVASRFVELASGIEHPLDYRILLPEGGFRWVQSSSNPIFRDGDFSGVTGILADIHKRRIAEEKLLREKMFIDTILDTLPGIFFMVDTAGNFTRWKGLGKMNAVFGYPTEEIWRMKAPDILAEKDRHIVPQKMKEVLENGYTTMEVTLRFKNGREQDYQISCSSIERDSETYIIGVGIDITDRKRAEEERERTRIQLLQAQKMEAVGTLAGGIAHDFNNMLGGIMGSINLIEIAINKDGLPDTGTIRKYIQTAKEASRRAADLTRQLLTLSRRSEIKLAPVDMTMSINHVLKLCANSFPKQVVLNFQHDETPLRVLADPIQMEQVLLNLFVNASHAMTSMRHEGERRGGVLSVLADEVVYGPGAFHEHPDAAPGPYIRVRVIDEGVGMSEEIRSHVFDPFFTTKDTGEGTGLGLSITYSIVQKHGGYIKADSEPGKGSTFTLCLPALVEDQEANGNWTKSPGVVAGGGRLLVVDDEETMLRVTRGMLEHCGYQVITACGAEEAVEIFKRENDSIDGVLLDFSMPGASGLEVFEKLKAVRDDVKVLLSSGFVENADLQQARRKGIRGFLPKPFTLEALSEKVKKMLG